MHLVLNATNAGMEKSARTSFSKLRISDLENQSVKMAGSLISGQSSVKIK